MAELEPLRAGGEAAPLRADSASRVGLPEDWQDQVARAYAVFGVEGVGNQTAVANITH